MIGCWVLPDDRCNLPTGELRNVAAPAPWDALATGVPTLTTVGNNANTHEAWGSPLTPGGLAQAPVSPTREYTTEFTDAWNNSQCNPANLVPGGNDILASVDQPVRRAQPDARLQLLPRLHRGELQPAARQPRPRRRGR